MLYNFFTTQWQNPSKGDCTELIKDSLEEFGIFSDFDNIRSKSKDTFKKIVKAKFRELALSKLSKKQEGYTKMANVAYFELKIPDYMLREDLKNEQKRLIFKVRTRMAEYV